jgi:hypothetical protein
VESTGTPQNKTEDKLEDTNGAAVSDNAFDWDRMMASANKLIESNFAKLPEEKMDFLAGKFLKVPGASDLLSGWDTSNLNA